MKTMLLKCFGMCVACLLLVSLQKNSFSKNSSIPDCPEGYYYTDCVPAAIGLSDPCYAGCAPVPGSQMICDAYEDESYTIKMGCKLKEIDDFCSVECSNHHSFVAKEHGKAKRVFSACPICGSTHFSFELSGL